jgi:hypothetical protein
VQQAKQIKIKDTQYEIYPFAPRSAIKILPKLTKYILAPLSELLDNLNVNDIGKKEISGDALSGALDKMASRLDENHIMDFVLELLSQSTQAGKQIDNDSFDIVFNGKLDHLFPLLKEIVMFNFGSFLAAGGIGNLKSQKAPTDIANA